MKQTKRLLALLLALALTAALFTACGKKDAAGTGENAAPAGADAPDLLQTIRDCGYIVVATEGDWAPWTYHNEKNVLTGFDVELAYLIASGLGVGVKFEETAWDSILIGVDAGRFDIACNGVSYTEDRAESYTFSTPYLYTGAVIVTRSDNSSIQSMDDLKGKTTANTASSTYAQMAEEAGAAVTPVDSLADTLNMVIDGRVDATLNARGTIETYLAEHPEAPVKIVGEAPGEQMVIPMKKGAASETLRAEIDRILDELRANGKLSALSKKYFGEDLTKAN